MHDTLPRGLRLGPSGRPLRSRRGARAEASVEPRTPVDPGSRDEPGWWGPPTGDTEPTFRPGRPEPTRRRWDDAAGGDEPPGPRGQQGPPGQHGGDVEYGPRRSARGRRWVRVLRRVLAVLLAAVVALAAGFGVLLVATPSTSDAHAQVTAQAAEHHATALSGALPTRVVEALVATEDSRFYSHHGIDPVGAVRGVVGPLLGDEDQGGATLDQQLVKILYTGGRRTLTDRVEQTALAVKLDARYSKTDILRMYLDTVYFGHGYYGITSAAAGYFGRTPTTLTWTQATLLAGLVQAPSAYDPYNHLDAARQRQTHVLDRLVATGHLTRAQATRIAADPLNLR
ncbi:biosynthetic peptidoglycan transglycosylase [Frankia sp. AgB32]|uniref:biosynthetic peptidoglycan transglycosylase n=1 Tax=Frankia sp. AgB32 TaxID=631119 RepID=UPI00200BF713|nr:biosynthetic peptidoglycan transglycosylase [Frankia sp. AgB32]MCK9896201.1 transglycosylase domain-containing protein [Frankia sp. AgB32]